MEHDILKPKEENLLTLAAELGLLIGEPEVQDETPVPVKPEKPTSKSTSQLT